MLDRFEAWLERAPIEAAARVLIVCVLLGSTAVLAAWCSGCASPIQGFARGGTVVASAHLAAGDQVDAARDHALDAVEAAHPAHGPERSAALDAEAARWEPLGRALDEARVAIQAYAQAVTLAHAAQAGDEILPELARLLARVVLLYDAAADVAHDLGVELPRLPEQVRSLAHAIGGA